ncbi:hypothetical protein EVAR_19874_1 [Eumeta japonica]|uniref:Uncharacterized protein n=1 Tax=Eumeta variegata TaxID=151549 RepID=A0A4C1XN42_EUMVA|nr:hypothetical protein EVAR_19874_1 [Eumeta japonica]
MFCFVGSWVVLPVLAIVVNHRAYIGGAPIAPGILALGGLTLYRQFQSLREYRVLLLLAYALLREHVFASESDSCGVWAKLWAAFLYLDLFIAARASQVTDGVLLRLMHLLFSSSLRAKGGKEEKNPLWVVRVPGHTGVSDSHGLKTSSTT